MGPPLHWRQWTLAPLISVWWHTHGVTPAPILLRRLGPSPSNWTGSTQACGHGGTSDHNAALTRPEPVWATITALNGLDPARAPFGREGVATVTHAENWPVPSSRHHPDASARGDPSPLELQSEQGGYSLNQQRELKDTPNLPVSTSSAPTGTARRPTTIGP